MLVLAFENRVRFTSMRPAAFLFVLSLVASVCAAAAQSPPSGIRHSKAALPCVFDFERGELPDCVREAPTGQLTIATQYLGELTFDEYGLAAVLSHEKGWMYVNRKGKVLIAGVVRNENGPDPFRDGMVRFMRDNKYGFANRKGHTVILPIYDGAMSFDHGITRVCKGCQEKCAEAECEHHVFEGGEWFSIDSKGRPTK
jgi:WG containing repeat